MSRRQSHGQQAQQYAPTNGTPDAQQALQSSWSTPELTGYGSYPTPGGPVQQPSYADYVHPSQSYYPPPDQPQQPQTHAEYNPQAYANVGYNPAAYPPQPPPQSPRAPYSYAPSAASPPHSASYHQAQHHFAQPIPMPEPGQPYTYPSYLQDSSSYYPPPPPPSHIWSPSNGSQNVPYGNIPYAPSTLTPDELNLPSPPVHPGYHSYNSAVSPQFSLNNLPSPSGPPPPPPAHGQGPQRSGTLRHPQNRPLPGPPEPDVERDYFHQPVSLPYRDSYATEQEAQEDLFNQVESAVLNAGAASSARRQSPRVQSASSDRPQPLFSPRSSATPTTQPSRDSMTIANIINEYSDESDVEALAGLEAMRMAEAQEADANSRGSALFGYYGSSLANLNETDDTEVPMDMSTLSGGYDAHMSYGGDPNTLAAGPDANGSNSLSASNSMRRSVGSSNQESIYEHGMNLQSRAPPVARVDAGGTGGLTDPDALNRRQSFDEGDEYSLTDDIAQPGEPPDMFFHPGHSSQSHDRPLPPPPIVSENAVPRLNTSLLHQRSNSLSQPQYRMTPDNYTPSTLDSGAGTFPRSASLLNHSQTPQVHQPARSKTDAEERRLKQGYRGSIYNTFDSTPAASTVALDLPSLPTKRFNPAKLGGSDFKKCEEPWALSSILQWLFLVADPEKMTELKESMVKEALVALFTNKVPTMNIADAEVLSNRVVENMYAAKTLIVVEEWVRLNPGHMSGVIFQLTLNGCYSHTVHNHIFPGRCYAHHCQRTLKKVNLQAVSTRASEDWATFYKLKKEDVEGHDKKEIELQNNLHEIVQTEEGFMENLDVMIRLYRDPLATANPSIISPNRQERFLRDVFGKLDLVKKANVEHLLPQLKYRQQEQGPWVKGFSDIFRQWIRKAKTAYIEYATGFPSANSLMRQELEKNISFRNFVEVARVNKLSNKLGWDNYLKAPITRLQRYSLLLQTVHKNMLQDCEERTNLATAIEEIRAVTLECDSRVADQQRKVDLSDLSQKLMLRPGMASEVELNLTSIGRELIYQGDLQRMGTSRFTWLECHALLFDHYLVLAKAISVLQKGAPNKVEKYDVSRLPIPMDLLVLENINEDAVVRSSYVKGITSVTPLQARPPPSSPDLNKMARITTAQSAHPTLASVNTGSSMTSLNSVASAPSKMSSTTVLDGNKDSEKIMYPFRIKHLGSKEPYTLFAATAGSRSDWYNKIIEAKTKHAAALFAQNAEPFRLRVIADSAFYYDSNANPKDHLGVSMGGKPVIIKGTPLDRAVKEVEHRFQATGRPAPICRARVNCATSFTTSYPGTKHMVAVGTDFGVYCCEMDNPRGWFRAIAGTKVTQVAVLEEFNLFLLLADKILYAHHLDVVCQPLATSAAETSSSRKAPQKLSGSRDVGFFAVGRMKDRTLVFYKKRDGISSTFKVLEPIYQKSTEKKRGIFKRGNTEFFRDYDDFYIGTECHGMNLFHSSLAISSDKGFEVLTLDKKQPWSVPDWKAPEVSNILRHVEKQETLGMLRLNDQEFLLCYNLCAVYVNKHGEISRSVVMNFVANAKSAALYGPYLVLFDNEFVEVRNAQNGRLKQIIAGKDIKCLDDGGGGTLSGGSTNTGVVNGVPVGYGAASRTIKIVMQHPALEKTQIIVEMVLNNEQKE
ncbi:hypothetical protein D6C91_06842 [Aureobasidium pullulans]|uniref:CNH domain-containing protein n=1 Tax=Aureobasidium pullulans TaxID=5580 RepID=A0A4S9SX95_AURPU|nr:hypothetical protein D6C91_06842 [Aureobasidium pullulans]